MNEVKVYDNPMNKEVFQKEEQVLGRAMESLEKSDTSGMSEDPAFQVLVKEYGKLLRQSRRLVTMGDRMQHSLNRLNRDLIVSEERYRGIFENVSEGIYRCEPDGALLEANPAMAAMFGFRDQEEFLAQRSNIKQLFCSLDDYKQYESALAADGVKRQEMRACGPDNATLWLEISATSFCREGVEGAEDGIVGILTDVTERKMMLEEMCKLARTDSLTGLWNRGYFMELAKLEVARSARNRRSLSLLIMDVDYFKAVNDSHGHCIGDQALVALSRVLQASVRDVDIVARYGGEEFVVLLPDASREEACVVANRITGNIRSERIDCGVVRIPLTVSVGLTSLESGDDDLDGLLKFADIALYAAKKKGRDRVEVYRREPHCFPISRSAYAEEARLPGKGR
ncbi:MULTISPECIES: sensor domain-containing diguanylate cyclase [unclassified Pseudodesulfovibrio]|uniref:sensor domain-containing diguanylate cyclase n=1 Tax=unclassified Pseudodesulfovibrio TaxID=2661612 RepID=UPI001F4FD283|nr:MULTISPECIES: sensor domain-containing diguanylate cyclase [unclassified Pseudodesulfovibrio]MCJ2163376.1 sensor domain-containing diguanylate cyclase [Pseudodesulfovibrio sp. S3-i]